MKNKRRLLSIILFVCVVMVSVLIVQPRTIFTMDDPDKVGLNNSLAESKKLRNVDQISDPKFRAAIRNIIPGLSGIGEEPFSALDQPIIEGFAGVLNIDSARIKKLAGIDLFSNIKELVASNNELLSIDLSKNTTLVENALVDNYLDGQKSTASIVYTEEAGIYKIFGNLVYQNRELQPLDFKKIKNVRVNNSTSGVTYSEADGIITYTGGKLDRLTYDYETSNASGGTSYALMRNVEIINFTTGLDIPDANFRKWINNNVLKVGNIDQPIPRERGIELSKFKEIVFNLTAASGANEKIRDLTGINYFSSLTKLEMNYHLFPRLDVTSHNYLSSVITNHNTALTQVRLPANTTNIVDDAFAENTALYDLVFPTGLKTIGKNAFANIALTSITLPNVTSVGSGAFERNSKVTSITLPDSLTKISDRAFADNGIVSSLHIGNRVTSIGNESFANYRKLATLELPVTLKSIGNGAFKSLESITGLIVPNEVETIGNEAFKGANKVNDITFPEKLLKIGEYAFQGAEKIYSIDLPENLLDIKKGAFKDCHTLETVHSLGKVKVITSEVFSNTKIAQIQLSNDVTTIENLAFGNNSFLKKVDIGNGITAIADGAFTNTSGLKEITIFRKASESPTLVFNQDKWAAPGVKVIYILDQKFTVNFYKDPEGTILHDTQTVLYGTAAKKPTDPIKEGFAFAGWDASFDDVRQPMDIKPIFKTALFKVIFRIEAGGDIISEQQVIYGQDAIVPANPAKKGWIFREWNTDSKNVKMDLDISAVFDKDPNSTDIDNYFPTYNMQVGAKLSIGGKPLTAVNSTTVLANETTNKVTHGKVISELVGFSNRYGELGVNIMLGTQLPSFNLIDNIIAKAPTSIDKVANDYWVSDESQMLGEDTIKTQGYFDLNNNKDNNVISVQGKGPSQTPFISPTKKNLGSYGIQENAKFEDIMLEDSWYIDYNSTDKTFYEPNFTDKNLLGSGTVIYNNFLGKTSGIDASGLPNIASYFLGTSSEYPAIGKIDNNGKITGFKSGDKITAGDLLVYSSNRTRWPDEMSSDENFPISIYNGEKYCNFYYRAPTNAVISGKTSWGDVPLFNVVSVKGELLTGTTLTADQKGARPLISLDVNKIAFAREKGQSYVDGKFVNIPASDLLSNTTYSLALRTNALGISSISQPIASQENAIQSYTDAEIVLNPKATGTITIPVKSLGGNKISAFIVDSNGTALKYAVFNSTNEITLTLDEFINTGNVGNKVKIALFNENISPDGNSDKISISEYGITFTVKNDQIIDFTDETKEKLANNNFDYGSTFSVQAIVKSTGNKIPEVTKPITFSTINTPVSQGVDSSVLAEEYLKLKKQTWEIVDGNYIGTGEFEVVNIIPNEIKVNIMGDKAEFKEGTNLIYSKAKQVQSSAIGTIKRKIILGTNRIILKTGDTLVKPYIINDVLASDPSIKGVINNDVIPFDVITKYLVGNLTGNNKDVIPISSDDKILGSAMGNIWKLEFLENKSDIDAYNKFNLLYDYTIDNNLLFGYENSDINIDDTFGIFANNMIMELANYKQAVTDDQVKEKLIEVSEAMMIKFKNNEIFPVTEVVTNAIPDKGDYEATFSSVGIDTVAKLKLVDHHEEDTTNKEAIYGNDISISYDEAKKMVAMSAQDKLKEVARLGNVYAYSTDDLKSVPLSTITMNLGAEKGRYTESVATAKGTMMNIDIYVRDNAAEDNDERISANNITMSISEVEALLAKDTANQLQDMIVRTVASADSLINGSDVAITSLNHNIIPKKGDYIATFMTAKGTNTTSNIRVVDENGEDVSNKERITANNYSISIEEATTFIKKPANEQLTEVILRSFANAESTEDGSKAVITNLDHAIIDEKGTYEATLSTDKGTSVIILVQVSDRSAEDVTKQERISANNIFMSMDEATLLLAKNPDEQLQVMIMCTNASAISLVNGSDIDITSLVHTITKEKGTYDVTLATAKGTSVQIVVQVLDNTTDNPDNDERISANKISISLKEAEELLSKSTKEQLQDLIIKTDARAEKISDGARIKITSVDHKIQLKKGDYDTTFKTAKGTTLTTTVRVLDQAIVDPTNEERISANSFEISIEEATLFLGKSPEQQLAEVITRSLASAESTIDSAKIQITALAHSIGATKGFYEVTLATGKGTSVKVFAHVLDNSKEDVTNEERIIANNIAISKQEATSFLDKNTVGQLSEMIKRTMASATSLVDGSQNEITCLIHNITKEKGTYTAILLTEKGTSVQVWVKVLDNSTEGETTQERILANNIAISKDEASNLLTKDPSAQLVEMILRTKATAASIIDGSAINVSAFTHNINTEKGTYQATLSTAKGTSVQVVVSVLDNTIEDITNKERIGANNITISKEEASYLLGKDATAQLNEMIVRTSAFAESTDDGTPIKITNLNYNFTPEKGTYQATLSTAKGTSVKVIVLVKDNTIEDLDDKERISANNIYISIDQANNFLNQNSNNQLQAIITRSLAKAESLVDGANISITSLKHSIQAIKGAYEATLATSKGTSINIEVLVRDAGTESSATNERIVANGIYLSIEQAQQLLSSPFDQMPNTIVELTLARAESTIDAHNVPVTKVSHDIRAVKGLYNATLSTDNNTSISIPVEVIDQQIIIANNHERLTANNIKLTTNQASELLTKTNVLATVVELSSAKAVSTIDGSSINYTNISHNIKSVSGIYEATLLTQNKSAITITVEVSGTSRTYYTTTTNSDVSDDELKETEVNKIICKNYKINNKVNADATETTVAIMNIALLLAALIFVLNECKNRFINKQEEVTTGLIIMSIIYVTMLIFFLLFDRFFGDAHQLFNSHSIYYFLAFLIIGGVKTYLIMDQRKRQQKANSHE